MYLRSQANRHRGWLNIYTTGMVGVKKGHWTRHCFAEAPQTTPPLFTAPTDRQMNASTWRHSSGESPMTATISGRAQTRLQKADTSGRGTRFILVAHPHSSDFHYVGSRSCCILRRIAGTQTCITSETDARSHLGRADRAAGSFRQGTSVAYQHPHCLAGSGPQKWKVTLPRIILGWSTDQQDGSSASLRSGRMAPLRFARMD